MLSEETKGKIGNAVLFDDIDDNGQMIVKDAEGQSSIIKPKFVGDNKEKIKIIKISVGGERK